MSVENLATMVGRPSMARMRTKGVSRVKSTVGQAGGGFKEGGADGAESADEADEDLGFGFVGDDVGGVAAVDLADVEGAGADAFEVGQGHGEQLARTSTSLWTALSPSSG